MPLQIRHDLEQALSVQRVASEGVEAGHAAESGRHARSESARDGDIPRQVNVGSEARQPGLLEERTRGLLQHRERSSACGLCDGGSDVHAPVRPALDRGSIVQSDGQSQCIEARS